MKKLDNFFDFLARWIFYIIIGAVLTYCAIEFWLPYEVGKYEMYRDYYERNDTLNAK